LIQKKQLKAKECREILEWIEHDRFENVEYLAKGGFGTIYKAIWKDGYIEEKWDSENNQWKRSKNWDKEYENFPVALKCLHNSQDITSEFLREIESHTMIISGCVTKCFGITRDPESNNFMMVIEYAKDGSLRQYLNNRFNSIKWVDKLNILRKIAVGLKSIHKKGLIHRDLHCGNMLKDW
ncbi:kinase-like domain-containing protein, partial [Rhizophagus diaphanus]